MAISGAEVGCHGEVGSAAAGLAEVMGGSPEKIENAADRAGTPSRHDLRSGGWLVQVPRIERNALGAVKAASLALKGYGSHFVPLYACIETMRQNDRDMSEKYKGTSTGVLAVNLVEC